MDTWYQTDYLFFFLKSAFRLIFLKRRITLTQQMFKSFHTDEEIIYVISYLL